MCGKVRIYKADERGKRKRRMNSFVGVGDTDLLTNPQSIAIQTGIIVQHAIETAAVSFGNLPARITRLDIIVGATLRAGFRRWLCVNGSDQPKHQEKANGDEQDEWEQGAVG